MLKLESVQAFAAIAETGSITGAAAERLAISKSVVSERLAELELSLDAKLVHRTTRTLLLTEDGNVLLRARAAHRPRRGRSGVGDWRNVAASLRARCGSRAR